MTTKRKPKPKTFNIQIPIHGATGFRVREILHYTGVKFQGKEYSLLLIPKDGLSEIEVVEES